MINVKVVNHERASSGSSAFFAGASEAAKAETTTKRMIKARRILNTGVNESRVA